MVSRQAGWIAAVGLALLVHLPGIAYCESPTLDTLRACLEACLNASRRAQPPTDSDKKNAIPDDVSDDAVDSMIKKAVEDALKARDAKIRQAKQKNCSGPQPDDKHGALHRDFTWHSTGRFDAEAFEAFLRQFGPGDSDPAIEFVNVLDAITTHLSHFRPW
jgi:hypothetical protein